MFKLDSEPALPVGAAAMFKLDSDSDDKQNQHHSNSAQWTRRNEERCPPAAAPHTRKAAPSKDCTSSTDRATRVATTQIFSMMDVKEFLGTGILPPHKHVCAQRVGTPHVATRQKTYDIGLGDLKGMKQLSTSKQPEDPNKTIYPTDLKEKEKAGHGVWGDVYKANWHGHTVAVKYIRPDPKVMEVHGKTLGDMSTDFERELRILRNYRMSKIVTV
jgi:hypothetical protein